MAEPSRSKLPIVAGVIGLSLVLALAIPWALRGTIATSLARDELAARGLECDERFAVSLSATFDEATVGPTRCARAAGLVEAIELLGDLTVELEGLEPARARVDSLRIVLRETDVRGGASWASELRTLGLEQRVAGMVKGLGEVSGLGLPPLEATAVEVVRGRAQMASARGLALGEGAPTPLRVQQIEFSAGPGGVGRLTLSQVTGTASRSAVHLEGQAAATAGIALFQISRGGAFSLDARALDTASPTFTLDGDF